MPEKVLAMPHPASPSIHEALGVFLVDQRRRLSRRTFDAYDSVIMELGFFLRDHGPETLHGAETALLNQRILSCGCTEHDYLMNYGPEHVLRNLDRFLAPCRGPIRLEDQHRARMRMRVGRKLRGWLTDGGWVKTGVTSPLGITRGHPDLDEGRRLTKILSDEISALELNYEDIDTDEDLLDAGLHDVSQISGDDLWFDHWPETGPVRRDVGPVHFPTAAQLLQPGWAAGCTLGRVRGVWYLFEVSCVYAV